MSSTQLQPKSTTESLPQTAAVIDRLFAKLHAYYGVKFTDAFSGVPMSTMQRVWAEDLAGYSLAEIGAGLRKCKALKWPPTFPEFLMLCRPPIDPESAFVEAIENMRLRELGQDAAWSHPAIYFTAVAIGSYEIRRYGYGAMKARWAAVLEHQLSKGAWGAIPPPQLALPAPVGNAGSPEIRQRLAEVTALLKAGNFKPTKAAHASA